MDPFKEELLITNYRPLFKGKFWESLEKTNYIELFYFLKGWGVIDNFSEIHKLISVNLHGRGLKKLPESIGLLENLVSLDLNGNRLTELPRSIVKLQKLEFLYLRGNNIKKVPESILKLKNLYKIHLGRNGVESLPDLTQLKNLYSLNLYKHNLGPEYEPLIVALRQRSVSVLNY